MAYFIVTILKVPVLGLGVNHLRRVCCLPVWLHSSRAGGLVVPKGGVRFD